MKQTAAAIEKGRHSQPVRRTHSLRPTAPRSYIPRPITRKGGMLPFDLFLCIAQLYAQINGMYLCMYFHITLDLWGVLEIVCESHIDF